MSATDAGRMRCAMRAAMPLAMHVTVRTDGRTETLEDAGRNLTFLDACDNGGSK